MFVAEQAGQVVGYVYAGIEPQSWKELREEAGFIHDVYVDEAARRGGVATALLEAAAEWLASRGMPRVVLWTAAPNEAARRLFERLGFRHTMTELTRETGVGEITIRTGPKPQNCKSSSRAPTSMPAAGIGRQSLQRIRTLRNGCRFLPRGGSSHRVGIHSDCGGYSPGLPAIRRFR